MAAITVIGSLNMDLVVRCGRIPLAGETLVGKDFHLIPGGKGANQAVAAAKAGAVTRMLGCVGDDAFAPILLDSLTRAGVDVSGVTKIENVSTGTATVLLEENGENRIVIVAGANARVDPDYIQQQWKTASQSEMILLQHEIPMVTVEHILQHANREGIRVFLNPAPVHPLATTLLSLVDTLILNELEASALTGIDVTDHASASSAARNLQEKGVSSVIITLGSNGVIRYDGREFLFQPAFEVETVDTTAAGDTFAGGYAASILNGKAPSEALLYATAASALAVTRLGAQTSIPTKEDVENFSSLRANHPPHSPMILTNGGV